jgi:hypothetical protein
MYVDPQTGGWNRPIDFTKDASRDELIYAMNDYSMMRHNLDVAERYNRVREYLNDWPERPELPELRWPKVWTETVLMTDSDLRAKICELIVSGVLPKDPNGLHLQAAWQVRRRGDPMEISRRVLTGSRSASWNRTTTAPSNRR